MATTAYFGTPCYVGASHIKKAADEERPTYDTHRLMPLRMVTTAYFGTPGYVAGSHIKKATEEESATYDTHGLIRHPPAGFTSGRL
jgi:hypothetical protein